MSKSCRDYTLFLEDILLAINKIEEYIQDISYQGFSKNDMMIDAVIRNFEVIGEAAKHIPARIRTKYPAVEWREAIGFRNVLIHDYFGIDVESVWDTIHNNLPLLKQHIQAVIMHNEKK